MNFEKLDAYLSAMPERGIPACEVAITKDGITVYRKMVGYSDAEGTKPVSRDDLYWIFSATKVVTCIAAMRLVEEGRLSLSDPVEKYIPEFGNVQVKRKDGSVTPAETVMTIEHLFLMTGGLTYDLKLPSILAAEDRSTLGLVRAMVKEPLRFEPGTHYLYSLCHDVLAAVVEVVSGMSFSAYLDETIFRPLGIRNMGFHPTEEQLARFSTMYDYKSGVGGAKPRVLRNSYRLSEEYESGGAGLFASVDDYVKIITALACGGTTADGYRLLSSETIRQMQENRLCDDAWNDFCTTRYHGYGWGLCGRVHVDPNRSHCLSPIKEFGWGGAAGALVLMDTENRLAFYYGQQVMNCSYIFQLGHQMLKNLLYEGLFAD